MAQEQDEFRFTSAGRHITDEEQIQLTSVGVDIGSTTSHLVFSRLELERRGTRYVVVTRTILYESEILLTPYLDETTIDGTALGQFIAQQYEAAGLRRSDVDTGVLIMTGVALLRQNARAIGDLFAEEAGRFVAVSAGDSLETTMAAHGSGAAALSAREGNTVMNVDIGGGTSKIAVCCEGVVKEVAAMDVGARLVVLDGGGVVARLEEAGCRVGKAVGLDLTLGSRVEVRELQSMATYMADRLCQCMSLSSSSTMSQELMRTPPLTYSGVVDAVTFSGGVSEFIYGREANNFGDLGSLLAEKVRERVAELGLRVLTPTAGIRATVIGASQYTVQVSGNTIFLSSHDAVPIRNLQVVTPELALDEEEIDVTAIRLAVRNALDRFDLAHGESPVALALQWRGSATYSRIHSLCTGIVEAMKNGLGHGNPLVLVCDGDIGGLLGIHLKEEMRLPYPVISIDGVELREFDYIDIGSLIPSSGAVPVVIKSLVFPV